jgi:hypothetical protein
VTRRVRTALISIACFTISFGLVLVIGNVMGRGGRGGGTATNDKALSVIDAAKAVSGSRVAVHGFVFFDPQTGPLLCSARTTDDPPACDGTVLRLVGLDATRLDLVQARVTKGGYDSWSRSVVDLLATKEGDTLRVEDVLR